MEERTKALWDLLSYSVSNEEIKTRLSKFCWDIEEPLVILTRNNLIDVLLRLQQKQLTDSEVEEWANIIESREDIRFEESVTKQFVFELANPVLYGRISDEKISEMLSALNDSL
ncbi:MAG: hypothetical protein ACK4E0_00855 [Chitinophagaceae bacterium]